jgi:hypothetical protein
LNFINEKKRIKIINQLNVNKTSKSIYDESDCALEKEEE